MLQELVQDIQKNGLSGVGNFLSDRLDLTKKVFTTDGQVDSALLLLGLLGIAAIPVVGAPTAGGVVLGTVGKSFIDIGTTIAQATDKVKLIRYLTSSGVRTTVVGGLLVLGLLGLGTGSKLSGYKALEDGMSPSAQAAYGDLSMLEQLKLLDAAGSAKISPGALDFYLEHANAGDARLASLPLNQALQVSALAEQSGQGRFLLNYVARYGANLSAIKALLDASPEIVRAYAEQLASPDTTLAGYSPVDGLRISSLVVDYGVDAVKPILESKPATLSWSYYVPSTYQMKVAGAFQGEPMAITLERDITVYQYWSDPGAETGHWLALDPSLSSSDARTLLALPNDNLALSKTPFTIPKGTTILIGDVAPQTGASWAGTYATGGGFQVYVSDTGVLNKKSP